MSPSGLKVTVEISLNVNQRINAALKSSVDGAELANGEVFLKEVFNDLGDARAYLNSTLRVINAAILTIFDNER